MKTSKIIIIGISLFIGIISCKKDTPKNDYCIRRIVTNPDTCIISEENLNTIKTLFESNHLDYSKYQFFKFVTDDFGGHHAGCYQFIHDLKVFSNTLIFHFNQAGNYYSLSGDIIEDIPLNAIPSMNQKYVVDKFLIELSKDHLYAGSKEEISHGCFDVEFGYYDLNAGAGLVEKKFTKAWRVKPKNNKCPVAYINDMTSGVIYYDNGIRYK